VIDPLPDALPEDAVMIAVPAPTALTRPVPPTVATDEFEDDQVKVAVTTVPEASRALALKFWVVPTAAFVDDGETTMLDTVVAPPVPVPVPVPVVPPVPVAPVPVLPGPVMPPKRPMRVSPQASAATVVAISNRIGGARRG
jgi:hypothetical protein